VQYSANGVSWSNNNVFTAADPGWSGWGSPANSILYVRNIASPNCYNYSTFINPCSAPLPATLLHFSGSLNKNNTVDLKWETTAEKNVSHFEIERSHVNAAFVQIGHAEAKGNSAIQQHYDFNDSNPFNGMNYYRLKTIDEDGLYTYSNIISLMMNSGRAAVITVYPNPAKQLINIGIDLLSPENTTVSIVDMLGNIVKNVPVKLQKGMNVIPVNLGQAAAGTYFIKVRLQNEIQVHKFTIE
jgi:hypothetical protein